MKWKVILLVMLTANIAKADAAGMPLSTNADWLILTNSPISQLYSGIVERAEIVTNTLPSIASTWTCFDHLATNTAAWTNAAGTTGTYVNVSNVYRNVNTTNVFGLFDYTNHIGNTLTGQTFITHEILTALDVWVEDLIPYFTMYHAATNVDAYNSQYKVENIVDSDSGIFFTNYNQRVYPIDAIPSETKLNLFYQNNIGYVRDPETNWLGVATNGTAFWTRQPPRTNQWVLAESHYTGAWSFVSVSGFSSNLVDDSTPVMVYLTGGTNAFASMDVAVTGTVWRTNLFQAVPSNVTVTLSSTNQSLADAWYSIDNITPDTAGTNTNDVISIYYDGVFALYGDRPYALYASDINERYEALKRLTYVRKQAYYGGDGDSQETLFSLGLATNTIANSISSVQAQWPKTNTIAINDTFVLADYDYDESRGAGKEYQASESKQYNVSNIYVNAIVTNTPYTYEMTHFLRERYYGTNMSFGSSTDVLHYAVYDFDGLVGSPGIVDGNRYVSLTNDTTPSIATQIMYTGFYDIMQANKLTDVIALPPEPSFNDVEFTSEYFAYEWLYPTPAGSIGSVDIGSGGTEGQFAEGWGFFYLNYDFEYK